MSQFKKDFSDWDHLAESFYCRHVWLREYYVAQLEKGHSMLEEKLICPMEDVAYERQFMTAQRGSSASTFPHQHVSIIARTLEREEMRLYSIPMFDDTTTLTNSSPSLTAVDPAGSVDHANDLLFPGEWTAEMDTELDTSSTPNQLLDSDLQDPRASEDDDDDTDLEYPSHNEVQQLLEQTRQRRKGHYRQKPAIIRINKYISARAVLKARSSKPFMATGAAAAKKQLHRFQGGISDELQLEIPRGKQEQLAVVALLEMAG